MKAKALLIAVLLGFTSIITSCSEEEGLVAPRSTEEIYKEPLNGLGQNNGLNDGVGNNDGDDNNDTGNGEGLGN